MINLFTLLLAGCDSGQRPDDSNRPDDTNTDPTCTPHDNDGDGFYSCDEYKDNPDDESNCAELLRTMAAGGSAASETIDCNDNDANVNPGAAEVCDDDNVDEDCDSLANDADDDVTGTTTWYTDNDGDAFGDSAATTEACEQPTGYVDNSADCDDTESTTYPGAPELCDGLNNDCDGDGIDEDAVDATTWYADADEDGYGASGPMDRRACGPMEGYADNANDCDDTEATTYPGAPEICDGLNNDCDADGADEDLPLYSWYTDADGDGFGDPTTLVESCSEVRTMGTEVTNGDDCNDTDPNIFPTAAESCNEIDDNCDGTIDEDLPLYTSYADADGDGYGDPVTITEGCTISAGAVTNPDDCDDSAATINPIATETCEDGIDQNCDGTDLACAGTDLDADGVAVEDGDCDDTNAQIYPGAAEICNEIDDNCDSNSDEGLTTYTLYHDGDADSYGDPTDSLTTCSLSDPSYVSDSSDCDDANAFVNPTATETCEDGIDQNCDGTDLACAGTDLDTDGVAVEDGDCDDTNATIYPGATETCNGVDDNCDGNTDEDLSLYTSYADADGDGYGDATISDVQCAISAGYVSNPDDCDDANASINPRATEVCDASNVDEDCDGLADDADSSASGKTTRYYDGDADTYGSTTRATKCDHAAGYTATNDNDCDDANAFISPAATEAYDGIDNDCDTAIDEGFVAVATYADADGDGFGDSSTAITELGVSAGRVVNGTDCDDADDTINPDADELCDAIDNDCNGLTDDDDPAVADAATWYADVDSDGYGDVTDAIEACVAPDPSYVSDPSDCDDTDPTSYPGATESCDYADNDCDGSTDEGVTTQYYADADSDGWGAGDLGLGVRDCILPTGYVANNTDCNDASASISPGATEVCDASNTDEDCDSLADDADSSASGKTTRYYDGDTDTYGSTTSETKCDHAAGYTATNNTDCNDSSSSLYQYLTGYLDSDSDAYTTGAAVSVCSGASLASGYRSSATTTDCNDSSSSVHPGATEICNEIDDDCDSSIDEGVTTRWYYDGDSDGYGTTSYTDACAGTGYYDATVSTDCSDSSATTYPGASELCDGVDNDCDGTIDDGITYTTYYRDADSDGYGSSSTTTSTCTGAPTGYVATGTDCNDGSASVWRTATVYGDADSDTYTNGTSTSACIGSSAPSGYALTASSTTDCNDSSASLYQYLTGYRDADSDTYTISTASSVCSGASLLAGYRSTVSSTIDCDDTSASLYQTATIYPDADSDGYTYGSTSACIGSSAPTGYSLTASSSSDCDESSSSINPGATEVCDASNVDEDCDSLADDADTGGASGKTTRYYDGDTDTYGSTTSETKCDHGTGYTATNNTDCNDSSSSLYQNLTGYVDSDSDAYTTGSAVSVCSGSSLASGYRTSATTTDCNDSSSSVHPGATETCNAVDDDCDGLEDEGVTITSFADVDTDGYGDAADELEECSASTGRVLDDSDCDDEDATSHPGAIESCDYADNDCDGSTDEGVQTTFYRDADSDTYGTAATTTLECVVPTGYASNDDDCNDSSSSVHPGATETCNSVDDDCDSSIDEGVTTRWYYDHDVDGYGTTTYTDACLATGYYTAAVPTDCDDASSSVHPSATETCNEVDDDCDSSVDEGVTTYTSYADTDGDSYGDPTISETRCAIRSGYVSNPDDCNDFDADINPGETEDTSTIEDDNCDGYSEGDLVDADVIFEGVGTADHVGTALGNLGDVTGDGIPDLAVGAPDSETSAYGNGQVYVFPGDPALGLLTTGGSYFTLTGVASMDYAGAWVSAGGDMNADGNNDLIVGARYSDLAGTNAGAAYLVTGPITSDIALSAADYTWYGTGAGDYASKFVAGVPDFDGDGVNDLLISAYMDDIGASNTGSAFLQLGPVGSGSGTLGSVTDTTFYGTTTSGKFGYAGAAADVDGDGYSDVAIGAADASAVYLFLGSGSPPATWSTAGADATFGGTAGTFFGSAVIMQDNGDLTGDGFVDLVVGSSDDGCGGTASGALYIIEDPLSGGAVTDDSVGAKICGETSFDQLGYPNTSVSVGDLNGDGTWDLLGGAGDAAGGEFYAWYGPVLGALTAYDGNMVLTNTAGGDAGQAISVFDDVDGDDEPEIAIGNPVSGTASQGKTYLIFGSRLPAGD